MYYRGIVRYKDIIKIRYFSRFGDNSIFHLKNVNLLKCLNSSNYTLFYNLFKLTFFGDNLHRNASI